MQGPGKIVHGNPENSPEAWYAFVEDYSGLIYSVIKRYLLRESQDERRTMYVDILQVFHDGKLAEFDGRAALSTWVTVVVRSRCLDFLRHKYGRREPPRWLRSCTGQEQEIYRLYYLEGVSFIEICARLSREGAPLALEDLAESIRRMEGRIDHSSRRRLAYDLEARSIGATSGMLLEFLDELKWRSRARYEDQNPERALLRHEEAAGLARLRGLLDELPDLERDVLGLRFFAGYTAGQISQELQVGNQRKVYSLIDRGLRRLRNLFNDNGPTASVTGTSLETGKRPKPEPGKKHLSHEG